MKDRIIEFLRAENKTSAQLAEEIGVQPSGISHILSGRNNPSLDFVLKMLERYKYISTDWLLFGKGNMYRDEQMQSLFDNNIFPDKTDIEQLNHSDERTLAEQQNHTDKQGDKSKNLSSNGKAGAFVKKIILFYDNNSFEEYSPVK